MKIFDITLPISSDLPVWPGDPEVSLVQTKAIARGDSCNLTMIQMGVHTGTHVDAPYHFIQGGRTIDAVPFETFIGPCLVIEIDACSSIGKDDLLRHDISGHNRILFKTRNSQLWSRTAQFVTDYVSLAASAAEYLVESKIILVGIDYLSIEAFNSIGNPVHELLLKKNIFILEGLDLSGVAGGEYELFCLPLKLNGCEGAPARVILSH